MAATTIRIREETRDLLRELEERTGERTQDLLARALDQYRRSVLLAETNAAYARLEEDPDGELDEWGATLADGLDRGDGSAR